jgi:predicted GNAT family acetyltransferase
MRMNEDEQAFALALDDLIMPPTQGFALRSATAEDRALMVEWRTEYHIEVLGTPAQESLAEAEADIDHYRTADSHRILSHDGRDVSMTGFNARTTDVVQIGGVYTPPEFRSRGFARTAVAMHLDEARAGGATRALLFSSSEKAIRAYRAIGFRPNGGFSLILFDGPQEVQP